MEAFDFLSLVHQDLDESTRAVTETPTQSEGRTSGSEWLAEYPRRHANVLRQYGLPPASHPHARFFNGLVVTEHNEEVRLLNRLRRERRLPPANVGSADAWLGQYPSKYADVLRKHGIDPASHPNADGFNQLAMLKREEMLHNLLVAIVVLDLGGVAPNQGYRHEAISTSKYQP